MTLIRYEEQRRNIRSADRDDAAGMDAVPATASNHLGGQSSVYLARAAGQPVDWYPWGAEAFKRAKELDRPILLDVGAVWCPWCGLMDRINDESFQLEVVK